MKCELCGHDHDGTYMRTHHNGRVRGMLARECPHDRRGLIELCHVCQRQIYFAGGYILYLAKITEHLARYPDSYMRRRTDAVGDREIAATRTERA